MKISGNTILVTGGGSGIGEALAQRWHALGNKVIVAGRRRAALEAAIAGREGMSAIALDIDSPEGIRDFTARLLAEHPDVNILVNNAGIMRDEDATGARDLSDAEATITTNLLGPIRLIDALVDHLKGRPDAAIVNLTSGLAFVPLKRAPTYSATKAALHSYTISLRRALAGQIEVIEVAPPAVRTELTPGQSTRAGYMPLDAFADEVIGLFQTVPTPAEINVKQVLFLRDAEAEGRFEQALEALDSL
jgi:uncharacterized oxidoreductase